MSGFRFGSDANPGRAGGLSLTVYDILLCIVPVAAFLSIVAFV